VGIVVVVVVITRAMLLQGGPHDAAVNWEV